MQMTIRLCDTQIISYAINSHQRLPSSDVAISSTTAQELLLVQGHEFTRNNYYVPFLTEQPTTPGTVEALLKGRGKFRKDFGKNRTDHFILDFGVDHPTIIEYSHVALAQALNGGDYYLLYGLTSILGESHRKAAVRRLRYLIDHGIQCIPVGRPAAEAGLELFRGFSEHYTLKRNFRNSLNDILTLAVAQVSCSTLYTHDELLATFAANYTGVPVNKGDESLAIDFMRNTSKVRVNRGSKGYVNKGWRVHW
jgi:predicted nucleic acid-binding protein